MRWITFILLLYIMAALQAAQFLGLPHRSSEPWPRIEYLVLLTVFYSLFADEQRAPVCGALAGLALDLLVDNAVLGTHTLALGLIALGLVRIRLSIFRENTGSQVIMTILAVLAFAVLTGLLMTFAPNAANKSFLWYLGLMSANAVYTGLAAPLVFWMLFRLRPILGFGTHGPRSRA